MLGRGAGCVVVGGAVVVAKATAFWRQASLRQFMYSAIMNPTGSGQVVAAWATTAPKGELLKELVTEAAMAVRLRVMSGCIWWAGKRGSECVWCCRDRSVVGNIFHIYMKWRNGETRRLRQEDKKSKQANRQMDGIVKINIVRLTNPVDSSAQRRTSVMVGGMRLSLV